MDMCKVYSSSDSESDTSPRRSDASCKTDWKDGNQKEHSHQSILRQQNPSVTPSSNQSGFGLNIRDYHDPHVHEFLKQRLNLEEETLQVGTGPKRPTQKPFGRHKLQPRDPYDGSAEDSDSHADGPKRQKNGGLRMKERGRRVATNPVPHLEMRRPRPTDGVDVVHLTDVQMRSSSDSELKAIHQGEFPYRARKCTSTEMPVKTSLYPPAVPFFPETSFEFTHTLLNSPTRSVTLSKRKSFFPLADGEENIHRKKQCITQMETETIFPEG
ncbi:uncharacterized protein [Hoplias malabaricus]|uniref:uncharacterized protein isoform X2 n=1 Tax=Hoplias malabaricus TaxID=27720 RepID=UPI0034637EF7